VPQTEVIFYCEGDSILFRDWLESLPEAAKVKCLRYVDFLRSSGHELRRPLADFLRDGIYELRPTSQNVNYRILYAFVGKDAAIVSHGIAKKSEVPDVEINKAVERVSRYKQDRSFGAKYEE
jgi:hypothetical protein